MLPVLLIALCLVSIGQSSSILLYGQPSKYAPSGFSLYDPHFNSFTPIAEGALFAPPTFRGVLVGPHYVVVYGWFDWAGDDLLRATNLIVYRVQDGGFYSFDPSVWGHGVNCAAWKDEQAGSFYVMGQIRGLDSSPDVLFTGLALCVVDGGCENVGGSLTNVPDADAQCSLVWDSGSGVLTAVWLSKFGTTFIGSYDSTDTWQTRSFSSSVNAPISLPFFSQQYWLLFDRRRGPGLPDSSLCAPRKYEDFGVYSAGGTGNFGSCWVAFASGLEFNSFVAASPTVAMKDGLAFYVAGYTNSTLQIYRLDPSFPGTVSDVTYNFPVHLVRYFGDTVLLTIAGRHVFVVLPSDPSNIYHLMDGGARWGRRTLASPCGDNSTFADFSSLPFFSYDGRTLFWTCPLSQPGSQGLGTGVPSTSPKRKRDRSLSLMSWDMSDASSTPLFVGRKRLPVYRAGVVQNMCVGGTNVWVRGDFVAVGEVGSLVAAPFGTAVWQLGTGIWQANSVGDTANAAVSCRSSAFLQRMWFAYLSVDVSAVAIGCFDFSQQTWQKFKPLLAGGLLPLGTSEFIKDFAGGPGVVDESRSGGGVSVLMPMCYGVPPQNRGCGIMSLQIPMGTEDENTTAGKLWEMFVEFRTERKDDPTLFTFYGIEVVEDYVWLCGKFSVVAEDGTKQVNLLRVSRKTKKIVPLRTPTSTQFVVTSFAVGNPFDDKKLLWVGGQFGEIPGIGTASNIAAINLETGDWDRTTVSLNAPPVATIVSQLVFDTERKTMFSIEHDPASGYATYHSGMTVFSSDGVLPNPAAGSAWFVAINKAVNIDLNISAPLWSVILTIALTLAIIALVSVAMGCTWSKWSRRTFRYIEIPDYASHGVETNFDAIMRDQQVFKINADELELNEVIGHGGQGLVRRATYNGQDVAAKAVIDFSQEVFSAFAKEIKMLATLSHPNIVRFVGVIVKEAHLYLVTELMDTDLLSVLDQLTETMKLQVCVDVASAVAYLHSFQPPILHRDLKPSNILISRDGHVKLADFGVSRLLLTESKGQMTRDAGTLLYMAPEVWNGDAAYGTPADVYSLGLVFIEIWTGKNPFYPAEFTVILEFMERIKSRQVLPGIENLPKECPEEVVKVIRESVLWDPDMRMSATDVCQTLASIDGLHSYVMLPNKRKEKHKRGE